MDNIKEQDSHDVTNKIIDELIEQRATSGKGVDGSEDVLIWGNVQKWFKDGNPAHIDAIAELLGRRKVIPTFTVFQCIAQVARDRLQDISVTKKTYYLEKAKEDTFLQMARIEVFCSELHEFSIQNLGNWGAAYHDNKYGAIGIATIKSSTLQKQYVTWKSDHSMIFNDLVKLKADVSEEVAISFLNEFKKLKLAAHLVGNRRE